MHLHSTNSVYTKLLEVKHTFPAQVAITGAGRGEYKLLNGPLPLHPALHELIKLDIVYGVDCEEGSIIITVSEPHRWGEIEGEIHHIIARHITENEKDQPNT